MSWLRRLIETGLIILVGLGTIVAALAIQLAIRDIVGFSEIPPLWLLPFATIETTVGFSGAYLLLKNKKGGHTRLEAIDYLLSVAFIYAMAENLMVFITSRSVVSLIGRLAISTPMHMLSLFVLGLYWQSTTGNKALNFLKGLALASFFHGGFNLLAIHGGSFSSLALVLIIAMAIFASYKFREVKTNWGR